MKKRSNILKTAMLAALCLVQCVWAQKVWDGKVDTEWYWDNTSQIEFTIKTAEQLAGLAQLVNGGNSFSGKTIKLGANILLNDTTNWQIWGTTFNSGQGTVGPINIWIPIGSYTGKDNNRSFQGTFDGGGYVVSGIYINNSNNYLGLFSYVDSGTIIKNLGVAAFFIKGEGTVGGLVGKNEGTITNCYTTGNVSSVPKQWGYNSIAGGLVGSSSGIIADCYATGNVSGGETGGLVGNNNGTITNCYAMGNVESRAYPGAGGLVGSNDKDGTITNCYAIGNVKSSRNAGGLVGINGGTIAGCYASGNVKGGSSDDSAGGLVGSNSGTITNCYATGNIKDLLVTAGGLVGSNSGTIMDCYATGNVKSFRTAGGLVGSNSGIITNCYATGNVEGSRSSGGLVGSNWGTITNCYAIGDVNGKNGDRLSGGLEGISGGLAGNNDGTITNCYATGNVSGSIVGGLVGSNTSLRSSEKEHRGTITNCYAMGNVNGSTVGGLVGSNKETITNCYATGNVSGSGTSVGGLVGVNSVSSTGLGGTVSNFEITNSYYDRQASGQSDIIKGEPKSTVQMKQQGTFESWDFDKIWIINVDKNDGYPYLQSSKSITTTETAKSHNVQEGKILTDKRDNKKYKTVIIGTQTWMAENLNYNAKGSKCYDNKPANCSKYGRLFDWKTAMKACPSGWHLPTIAEWNELYRYVDDLEGEAESNLKSASGWCGYKNCGGTDKFGFSALSGGLGNSNRGVDFDGIGTNGYWWSASYGHGAYYRGMIYSHEYTRWISYAYLRHDNNNSANWYYDYDMSLLLSVRCLQD